MAWLIYSYQIKVNGSRFPVQVPVFHSGCVSFKYGPPLCWGTLGILSKMHVRRLFIGFHVILRGYLRTGSVNEVKNKDTGKEMLILIITEDKQRLLWVSKDQHYWVRCKKEDCVYLSGKRIGIYESYGNTCMCLYLEKRDTRFTEKRHGRGATTVDDIQPEGRGTCYLRLYKHCDATGKQHRVSRSEKKCCPGCWLCF